MSELARILTDEILPRVQKPSRYLGGELNACIKDADAVSMRACMAFPDSYDLGLGNLGLQILYNILNQRDHIWCERVFAPHPDFETQLRARGVPLMSLESKTALSAFHLVGFTLQWELNYTNILNMLDLGGIPVFAEQRGDGDPIVVAGGPCVFNPEPLVYFFDAFVIGDGEEAVIDVADAVAQGGGRDAILDRLAALDGVYVPARYPEFVLSDRGVLVPPPGAPVIKKRLVRDLDAQPFPTDYLVPYTEQVHDRVSLEVLRGCTQGCRFCQAGMTTRPVRERSLENLATLQAEVMRKTGYEQISLVSLSTCDYSKVKTLVKQSVDLARQDHIAVSLPSLRLDSFSVDLAHQVSGVRKAPLTFAPEAATDRMRAVINKFITTEELLEMSRQCYGYGWEVVKLYFMIGQPTERDEDVVAIATLAGQVWNVGTEVLPRARVNLGVSTFVPKPQTPFQWSEQIDRDETNRRQRLLAHALPSGSTRESGVKFGRHDAWTTWLEGLTTRADRRGGWLIYYAWEAGARMDGWDEHLDKDAWNTAIERWEAEHGMSAADELRPRDLDEPLPWDHIDVMIPKAWLRKDFEAAMRSAWAKDCRQKICHECGVIAQEPGACTQMLKKSRLGAKAEAGVELEPPPQWDEPAAVCTMRFRFVKDDHLRFLSHKELLRAWIRTLRRAQMPIKYSEGYHPHASIRFSSALPVGMASEGDWCDVVLTQDVHPAVFCDALNACVPPGLRVLEAHLEKAKTKALMGRIEAARYRVEVPPELAVDGLAGPVEAWLAQESVPLQRISRKMTRRKNHRRRRWGKKPLKSPLTRPIDLRVMVAELVVGEPIGDRFVLEMLLVDQDGVPGKVGEVLQSLLGVDADALAPVHVRKLASYLREGDALVEPGSY